MDQIEKYIEELMEKSTPDRPIWNIEKIMQGLKSTWNYIDGCMIKAILEMYAITKEDKYLKFADDFIDCKVNADGTIEGYDVNELNIDNVNAGKTLFEKNTEKQLILFTVRLHRCRARKRGTSGTKISIRIRSGWTGFICVSRFIWNMRPVFMIKKIMTIFSSNFLMLKKI